MNPNEMILCFPSAALDDLGRFQGYKSDIPFINKLFNSDIKFSFQPRSTVESDPSFKQIITYSIIQYGLHSEDLLIFSYVRGQGGGEDRLKSKRSLGIGGHVSDSVLSRRHKSLARVPTNLDYIKSEAQREIDEEVAYQSTKPLLSLCGLINDDSNPVGEVHLGVVYRLLLSLPDVQSREQEIHQGEMITSKEALANRNLYESWSQILMDTICGVTTKWN